MKVIVHPADIQDRSGAVTLLKKVKNLFPSLKLVWADGGYAGKLVDLGKKYLVSRLKL